MVSDVLFLLLFFGLPIAVSLQLFKNEPAGRPFMATYFLAIIGSSIVFVAVALVLNLLGIGMLGPFDGLFVTIASVPIALIVGLNARRQRHQK